MKNLSIEYAHIYTSHEIGEEHTQSISLLKKASEGLNPGNYSLVVMVDDYSFPDPSFSYDEFTTWLSEQGFKPDKVVRESQLIPQCDETLSLVENQKLKKQITNYITEKQKYPCSLFIATWYLLRLGKLNADYFEPVHVAEKLLNILPESFRPFEEQGLTILAATKFKEVLNDIDYKYIEGRLVA